MYPEDRVLVGVMPRPEDLALAQEEHWYRVPVKRAPQGIHAEYIALYQTSRFPEGMRWQIRYFARRMGHELVRRVDLFPEEKQHPRAHEQYYRIQLAPLREKQPPILSLRWRRITFIYTTWDRFVAAEEINDLYSTESQFVDRVYHALKRQGLQPDREIVIYEKGKPYTVPIAIPCKQGSVLLSAGEERPSQALALAETLNMDEIQRAIAARGGPLSLDAPI